MVNFFGILANATICAAFVVFFYYMRKKEAAPNFGTWFITAVLVIINAAFFVDTSRLGTTVIALTVAVMVNFMFLYCLYTGRLNKIHRVDLACLIMGIVVGILRLLNIIPRDWAFPAFQAVIFLSYWPTIISVWKGTAKEKVLPWSIAVASYCFAAGALLAEPSIDWIRLIFPVVNGIIGNGLVAASIAATEWINNNAADCPD